MEIDINSFLFEWPTPPEYEGSRLFIDLITLIAVGIKEVELEPEAYHDDSEVVSIDKYSTRPGWIVVMDCGREDDLVTGFYEEEKAHDFLNKLMLEHEKRLLLQAAMFKGVVPDESWG